MCQAEVYWSAALKPPPETKWRLPASVSQDGFDGDSWYFFLRRMSLRWQPFESGKPLGPIKTASDVVPRSWALSSECFQGSDPEHHVATADLFHDERALPSQELFGGRKRPALINLELPRRCWLEECLANHGQSCGGEGGDGNPTYLVSLSERGLRANKVEQGHTGFPSNQCQTQGSRRYPERGFIEPSICDFELRLGHHPPETAAEAWKPQSAHVCRCSERHHFQDYPKRNHSLV